MRNLRIAASSILASMMMLSEVNAPVCTVASDESSKVFTAQPIASTPNTDSVEWQTFTITAYCKCNECCGKTDGITATGGKAKQGRTVAVDPTLIPYGSVVYIDGIGYYIAEDCGGAIKDNRIDVYFDSHSEAVKFGKQKKLVYIERGVY